MSESVVGRIEQLTHTPGPWTSRRDDMLEVESIEAVVGGRRLMIAMAHSYRSGSIDHDTRAANAHVMAASPDLLSALRRMLDCHQAAMDAAQSSASTVVSKPCECGACEEARAAVAKAEGRAS